MVTTRGIQTQSSSTASRQRAYFPFGELEHSMCLGLCSLISVDNHHCAIPHSLGLLHHRQNGPTLLGSSPHLSPWTTSEWDDNMEKRDDGHCMTSQRSTSELQSHSLTPISHTDPILHSQLCIQRLTTPRPEEDVRYDEVSFYWQGEVQVLPRWTDNHLPKEICSAH